MDIGSVPGEIVILPDYREVTGTPRGVIGPTWAMREKRRAVQGRPRAPSSLVRIGQGRWGGDAPLSSSPPLSFSTKARGGSPTPGGSRTPPGAPLGGRPHLPPPSFIYGGRGAPHDTQVDLRIVP